MRLFFTAHAQADHASDDGAHRVDRLVERHRTSLDRAKRVLLRQLRQVDEPRERG
jgi:hypothetical protein